MPFSIVRNDIARVSADAIVNAANTRLAPGGGVCGAIFKAAGYEQMDAACRAIGRCATGDAVVTPAFDLSARWCIHAVGPIWRGGGHGEEAALRSCYQSIFARVVELDARSVAFPLISAGIYGYPAAQALDIAREETRAFLDEHDDVAATLVVFDRAVVEQASSLVPKVRSYIDDAYVRQAPVRSRKDDLAHAIRWAAEDACPPVEPAAPMAAPTPAAPMPSAPGSEDAVPEGLASMLGNLDASFSQTLLALIDASGMTDAQVYHRANISRQLFSKIRSNPAYQPTKPTVVAFAFALELDVDAARDLLARAGFALSRASVFDVIVQFFLEHRMYDTFQLNEVLFAYDQPLVGSM